MVAPGIRVVPKHERLVVFRLGKCIGEKGPGIVFVIPFIDKAVRVDFREVHNNIPTQTCTTGDGTPIAIDLRLSWKVVDPVRSIIAVADVCKGLEDAAGAALRGLIGGMAIGDILVARGDIARGLHTSLDGAATPWGVRVTKVEIREVRREAA